MLRQETESYPITIGAWAHNKDDKVNTPDDECGFYIATEIYMLQPMGVMALNRVPT
jgi:hypothetical protein